MMSVVEQAAVAIRATAVAIRATAIQPQQFNLAQAQANMHDRHARSAFTTLAPCESHAVHVHTVGTTNGSTGRAGPRQHERSTRRTAHPVTTTATPIVRAWNPLVCAVQCTGHDQGDRHP